MIVPPIEITPGAAEVLIVLDPSKIVGRALVTVNDVAVMLLPMCKVLPAAEEINTAPKRVVPPIGPVRVMIPVPEFRVKVCVPAAVALIDPPNEIVPLAVDVLIVHEFTNVVGRAFVTPKELAVMFPPRETELVPAADEIRSPESRVVAPTVLAKETAPAVPEFNVRFCDPAASPLTVLENEMFPPVGLPPALVVSNVTLAPTTTSPVKVIAAPRVVRLLFKLIVPALPEPASNWSDTPAFVIVTALVTVIELPAAF